MRKRQVFGWLIFLVGVIVLTFSVLYDHHIDLGPFQSIYEMADWISISAFFDLLWDSFGSVVRFISHYFWCLLLILFGLALIFGARKQKKFEEENDYVKYDSDYASDFSSHTEAQKETGGRTLCRNLDDMKLAGVCSGIAIALNIDPTIVRIIVLFLGLSSGGGVFVFYIIAMLILPKEHLGRR